MRATWQRRARVRHTVLEGYPYDAKYKMRCAKNLGRSGKVRSHEIKVIFSKFEKCVKEQCTSYGSFGTWCIPHDDG